MTRKLSEQGIKLLRSLEGVRDQAYRDTGGVWTIGVGHVIKPDEQDLITATLSDMEIDQLLRSDLQWAERAVNDGLKVPVHQNQFDALVSFAFNVGANAFLDSTLLKRINANAENSEITNQFMRWTKDNGQEVPSLVNRRRRETGLFWQHLSTLAVVLCLAASLLFLTASITLLA